MTVLLSQYSIEIRMKKSINSTHIKQTSVKKSATETLRAKVNVKLDLAGQSSQIRPTEAFKLIKLTHDSEELLSIKLDTTDYTEGQKHTTTWLFRELKAGLQSSDKKVSEPYLSESVIGFKTVPQNISIDYWLTLDDKPLDVLGAKTTIEPIFASYEQAKSVSAKLKLNNFELIKGIGRGGFSKVYLGTPSNSCLVYSDCTLQPATSLMQNSAA